MKTIILSTLLVVVALTACKQKQIPPSPATTTFNQLFPGAISEWSKKDDGTWKIKFSNNGFKTSVSFFSDGSLKEINEEIGYNSLPENAKVYLQTNAKGISVEEIKKVTQANKSVIYEVELNENEILFDQNGKFFKEFQEGK